MNKITLGVTFVAIAALVGSPIMAEAIEDLYALGIRMDVDGNFNTIVFVTLDPVPKDGSVVGGYAIPTENGDHIAVLSHAGILDSESQKDANDAIWHSHLVQASPNDYCEDLGIDVLSFEEPSANVMVREGQFNTIVVRTIANGTATYTDALSNTPMTFTVGNPITIGIPPSGDPGSGKTESISFDLNVAETGTICLGNTEDP